MRVRKTASQFCRPICNKEGLLRRLIRTAGRLPVERDTLYNVITPPEAPDSIVAGATAVT